MGSLQNGFVYISIFHLMLIVVVTAIWRCSVLYKLYTYKSVESHTASASVDQFRRDSVLHCSVSVSAEIATKTSGEFSFDFYSMLFVLNQSFKWAENCDMMALRFFYLGLSSVGFISYFLALKIPWQKVRFCEISGYELVKSGLWYRATIRFHEDTVYLFHLHFDHVACGSSYKNGKSKTDGEEAMYITRSKSFQQTMTYVFLFCLSMSAVRNNREILQFTYWCKPTKMHFQ
jgi:hypothetical protein